MKKLFKTEGLYAFLPIYGQSLACSLYGLKLDRFRYNSNFLKLQREYLARDRYSVDEASQFSLNRLAEFLGTQLPRAGKAENLTNECVKSFLSDLPVVSKADAQSMSGSLKVDKSFKPYPIHTSGTTGAGLKFYATRQAIQEQWAVWWRYRGWHGIKFNEKCGYFGGRSIVPIRQRKPPFWRFNLASNQLLFSAYHISPDNIPFYLEALNRYKPPWLHGYPSILALLASYIVQSGKGLDYQVKWITTGAENLLEQQRQLIENAFGVRPRQHYGMAEAVANISECPLGRLHVDEDFAFVEFLPAEDGNGYRVIGTNFTNPVFPLIRYDTGDRVQLSGRSCGCGRPGRIVDSIDGRREDYVVLKDGSRVGRMDHVFKDLVNIREAQIYQKEAGRITVRVVRGNDFGEKDEEALFSAIRERLGDELAIDLDYVSEITRTSSGKLRFVISEIKEGQLLGAM